MASSTFWRRDLPLLIIIGSAIPTLLWRYISHPIIDAIFAEVGNWSSIISMLGWGIAVIYLFQGEYHNMKQKPDDMTTRVGFYALCAFSALLVFNSMTTGPDKMYSDAYQWWYSAFYRSESTAFYGLMFLYLCSASYRMLRARSLESFVLMAAGLLYIMRSSSMFALWFPWCVPVGEWIMNYPNKAATTAAIISATFGQVLIAVRQMLGRERTAIEVS